MMWAVCLCKVSQCLARSAGNMYLLNIAWILVYCVPDTRCSSLHDWLSMCISAWYKRQLPSISKHHIDVKFSINFCINKHNYLIVTCRNRSYWYRLHCHIQCIASPTVHTLIRSLAMLVVFPEWWCNWNVQQNNLRFLHWTVNTCDASSLQLKPTANLQDNSTYRMNEKCGSPVY